MNLKVPGAILPLGCAILSTRAITVRGVGTTPPLGELGLKCAIDLTDDYEVCSERVKDFKEFRKQTKCKRCNKTFMKKDKVIDHDHITGKYRGAAHSSCNTKLRIDPEKVKIPVFSIILEGMTLILLCNI